MNAYKRLSRVALAVAGSAAVFAGPSLAFELPNNSFVTYGDAQSYSLPILGFQAGCEGPGCPFYVNSTPGAIKGLTVLGTGANGQDVNANFVGMDNAYETPNSSGTTFWRPDPTNYSNINNDGASVNNNGTTTWDTSLSALKTYLTTGSVIEQMIFFFNNNQTKSGSTFDETLAAWAQITVKNAAGAVIGVYDFTNRDQAYLPVPNGGGVQEGPVGAYTHVPANTPTDPIAGDRTHTDYVLSGGAVCLDAGGNIVTKGTTEVKCFDHNLGANQAAYALLFPELNDQLADLFADGSINLALYTMSVDIRLGCDPAIPVALRPAICDGSEGLNGRSLNNGYEQIFISKGSDVVNVPEPGTLLLAGLALLGLAGMRRRS